MHGKMPVCRVLCFAGLDRDIVSMARDDNIELTALGGIQYAAERFNCRRGFSLYDVASRAEQKVALELEYPTLFIKSYHIVTLGEVLQHHI